MIPARANYPDLSSTPPHERPAVYWCHESQKWIFRAFAIGSCPLKLALIATGGREEFSEASRAAFKAGHEHERIVKDRLRARGFVIDDEQREIELDLGIALIRGHWDGRIALNPLLKPVEDDYLTHNLESSGLAPGTPCVLEVKSMREEDYMRFLSQGLEAFPAYSRQISLYSGVTGLPILYAVQCKSDLSLFLRYYPGPIVDFGDLMSRVSRVLGYIASIEGGESPLCVDFQAEKFRCSFEDRHDTALATADAIDLKDAAPELETEADRYISLGKQIKALEAERDAAKRKLREAIDATDASKMRAGKFSWQLVASKSTDYGGMIRDNPHLAAMIPAYERENGHWLRVDGPRAKKT